MSNRLASSLFVTATGAYLVVYFLGRIFTEGVRVDTLQIAGAVPLFDAVAALLAVCLFVGGLRRVLRFAAMKGEELDARAAAGTAS